MLKGNHSIMILQIYIYHEYKLGVFPKFNGDINMSEYQTMFDELLSIEITTGREFSNYIAAKIDEGIHINWTWLRLNMFLYFGTINFINYEERVDKIYIDKLKSMNILLTNNIYGAHNIQPFNINNIINNIENILFHKNDNRFDVTFGFTFNVLTYSILNDIIDDTHLIHNVNNNIIVYHDINDISGNLELNTNIININYFYGIIKHIATQFKLNAIKSDNFENIYKILMAIINIFLIIDKKFIDINDSINDIHIIIKKIKSPLLMFILKYYHNINIDVDNKELLIYLDRLIKFKKSSTEYLYKQTNIDDSYIDILINIVFKLSDINILQNNINDCKLHKYLIAVNVTHINHDHINNKLQSFNTYDVNEIYVKSPIYDSYYNLKYVYRNKKYIMIDHNNNNIIHKKNNNIFDKNTIRLSINNINFIFIKYNYYYTAYRLYQILFDDNTLLYCTTNKSSFIGKDNSLLQLYVELCYNHLNILDYTYIQDNVHKAFDKYNNEYIITLEQTHIDMTMNGNKILTLLDIIYDNTELLSIYIKLLKLCNSNIDDRPSHKEEKNRYYIDKLYNEIIPIILPDNKIKFICFAKNLFFIYDKNTKILTFMDDDNIIVTKSNFYFINRFIYNTNIMLINQGFNYYYLIIGVTNYYKIKFNFNGIFSEKKIEGLIYFLKEQINNQKIEEAQILTLNLSQNEDLFIRQTKHQKIDVNLEKIIKSKSIFLPYFATVLSIYCNIFDNISNIPKDKLTITPSLYMFFLYFGFDYIRKLQCELYNSSLFTNDFKEIGYENTTSQTLKKIYESYILIHNKNYTITLDDLKYDFNKKLLNIIKVYHHYDHKVIKKKMYCSKKIIHMNKKVKITKDQWYNGKKINLTRTPNDHVDIYTENIAETYKYIKTDYNKFINFKKKTSSIMLTKTELELLYRNIYNSVNRYVMQLNTLNIILTKQRFENMQHLNVIVNFNIEIINTVLILNKYLNSLNEINSLLDITKSSYDVTKILKTLSTLPIYIDKEFDSNLICFEYLFGNHIREQQFDFSKQLYNELTLNADQQFHQLLMGEGKSSVIAPILTLQLLSMDSNKIIYHVMPESLVNQSFDLFNSYFYFLNEKPIKLINTESNISDMFNSNIIIISDYMLKYAKILSITSNDFNMYNKFFIYDEVDEVSDPLKSQLNIIIGKKIKPANGNLIFKFIYEFIYELYFSEKYASLRDKFKSEYGFNNEPHFINQSTKLADEAIEYIKVIYIQLIDHIFGKEYADTFSNIITSDDNVIPFDDIDLNILRTLYNFYNLIPTILKQLHRRHFGLKYNDIENVSVLYDENKKMISLSKNYKLFIAVPFDSNESPSEKSEFNDYLYTCALTIICYNDNVMRRIRNIDIQLYLNYLYILAVNDSYKKIERNIGYIKYAELTSGMDGEIQNIFSKPNILNFSTEQINCMILKFPIKEYLLNVILLQTLKIIQNFNNISFQDIIKSSFSTHRIGFTGTPFIHLPLEYNYNDKIAHPIKSINYQSMGDGAIVASIVGYPKQTEEFVLNTKDDIINHAVKYNYHCIIDSGSFFINDDAESIAKKIIDQLKFKSSFITCVVFIDKQHKKTCMDFKYNKYPYENYSVPLINRFYFFDQSHITGIDMKIYLEAKGLITLSSFNRYRDIAQGIFRLRNINNGQYVHFCYNDNFKKNKDKTKNTIINFLLKNEKKYKNAQSALFYKESSLSIIRTFFESLSIFKVDDIDDNFKFLRENIYRYSSIIDNITIDMIKDDDIQIYKKLLIIIIPIIRDISLSRNVYNPSTDLSNIITKLTNIQNTDPEIAVNHEEEEEGRGRRRGKRRGRTRTRGRTSINI